MAEQNIENSGFVEELVHDMRAPLSAINGFATAMLDGTIPPEERERYIAIIAAESEKLSKTVDSILLAARLGEQTVSLSKERLDLADLVGEVLVGFEKEGVTVKADMQKAPLLGDKVLLQSAVYNLLENAFKYTDSGDICINVSPKGTAAYFCVSNPCAPLTEGELQRLTDKFYRASGAVKSGVKGTGLGLYIVQKVLSAHGSRLEIKQAEGYISFSFLI